MAGIGWRGSWVADVADVDVLNDSCLVEDGTDRISGWRSTRHQGDVVSACRLRRIGDEALPGRREVEGLVAKDGRG